jgi:hypothetical protein
MKNLCVIALMLTVLPAAVAIGGGSGKTPPGFAPGGPTEPGAQAKPAPLKDLKLIPRRGWTAEYMKGSVEWFVETPSTFIYICSILSTREPKDFADFVRKMQTENDPYGLGYRFAQVTDKGELADGYYVIGPTRLSSDKDPKDSGFAVLRKMGGQQLLFASYRMNDARERKEAMDWCRAATFGGDTKSPKYTFDPKAIGKLQATLPEGWREESTIRDIRSFLKLGDPPLWVFAALHPDPAPKSAEALADLAKKDPALLPNREWVKTMGIGKLPDGFFIVGHAKRADTLQDVIGAVRTIDGKTVLFVGAPAGEAAQRKELLGIIRSATFGK